MRHALGVILLLVVGLANAATVDTVSCNLGADICATGITGLEIDGSFYDVSFVVETYSDLNASGDALFWGDVAGATAAVNSTVSLLNTETSATLILYGGVTSTNTLWVATGSGAAVEASNVSATAGGWAYQGHNSGLPPGFGPTAVFSASVVPVPAAVWLFGSGLGLLGWFRRKGAAS